MVIQQYRRSTVFLRFVFVSATLRGPVVWAFADVVVKHEKDWVSFCA